MAARSAAPVPAPEPNPEPAAPPPPPPEVFEDQPEGLSLDQLSVAETPMDAPEGLSFDPPMTKVDEMPPAPATEDDIPTDVGMAPEGLSLSAEIKAPVLQLNFDSEPAMPEPTMPEPETLAMPEPEAPMVTEPPVVAEEVTMMTKIAPVLDFLKDDFQGSMILRLENNQLKPLIWDNTWNPNGEPKGPENLTDASAFRVVIRSKHPYLGHVVDTPINKNFFQSWGKTDLPEKVLIHPIIDEDGSSLLGVFVSVCDPIAKNPALLSAGERHAAEVRRLLKEAYSAAA
jgi:hypothetical protein